MSDKTETTFTPEQISQRAQSNFNGLSLVMVAYLKENTLSFDEFWSFVGRSYAQGWDRGMSAKEIAYHAALNMVSLGCDLKSSSVDGPQAEAVLGGWPSEDSLAFFGLTQEQADSIWGVFGPIAESLGYDYEWERQGDQVTITFSSHNNG